MTGRGRSLFGRVGRYVAGPDRDPRENRLTEAFAAVLDRVEGLGQALALAWLDPGSPEDPRERATDHTEVVRELLGRGEWVEPLIATQVACGTRWVDLELRFPSVSGSSADDLRVWVENKHGTSPERDQLASYSQRVASDVAAGAVVLLAPANSLPFESEVPASVPQRSWQSVARMCANFMASMSDAVECWLLEEFLSFLREESLMEPEAIGPEHLTALAFQNQAERGLAVVLEHAANHVKHHWSGNFIGLSGRAAFGAEYGASYDWPDERFPYGPDDSWFEWKVIRAGAIHPLPPDGALFIMAGLSVDRGLPFAPTEQAERWKRALTEGIDIDGMHTRFHYWTGGAQRLKRVAYPQEVLAGRTLAEQGKALGTWVVRTFRALSDPPVPYKAP